MKRIIRHSEEEFIKNIGLLNKLLELKFPEHSDEIQNIKMKYGPMAKPIIKAESISKEFAQKLRAELPKSIE